MRLRQEINSKHTRMPPVQPIDVENIQKST